MSAKRGGGQDVWHYHLQVYPRHRDDRLFHTEFSTRSRCGGRGPAPADRSRACRSAARAGIRQLKMRHEQVSSEGRGVREGDAVDVLGRGDRFPANHRKNHARRLIEATRNGPVEATDGQESTDSA